MASLEDVIDRQLRQLLGSKATWFIDIGDRHLSIWVESTTLEPRDLDRLSRWGKTLWQQWQRGSVLIFAAEPRQPFPYWWTSWSVASATPQATQIGETTAGDRFIICGLGSLGQFCIQSLRRFAGEHLTLEIRAIERHANIEWEIPQLTELLSEPVIIGDCRQEAVLKAAGIDRCRTLLAVTSDEATNIATAIVARRLNPDVHLVVRSSRDNLNALLEKKLGSFVALNPTELPAPAFALAALEENILAAFTIEGQQFRVLQQTITAESPLVGTPAHRWQRRHQRLISIRACHSQSSIFQPTRPHRLFNHWPPDLLFEVGDRPIWIERVEVVKSLPIPDPNPIQRLIQQVRQLPEQVEQFWQWIHGDRSRELIFNGLWMGSGLWLVTAILLRYNVPELTWQKAFAAGFILLLGGFGDVFGGLENDPIPPWLLVVCILVAIVSLLFIVGVLGLLAEKLLQARFDFLKKRPPLPTADHVIVVGLDRIGQQVVQILRAFRQPLVLLVDNPEQTQLFEDLPMLLGNIPEKLPQAHLETAKSVVLTTADEMLNLEAALIARQATEQRESPIGLVIGIYDPSLTNDLRDLLPRARPLCAYALAAEAFAGAAFGETMLGLFQIDQQTVLIADYTVTAGDTLEGKLIGEVAYGYAVIPIFYNRHEQFLGGEISHQFLPSDTLQLTAGDRLIVLATIDGLRRIEQGKMAPRRLWRLWVGQPRNAEAALEIGNLITKITGLPLLRSRTFIQQLPATLTLALYEPQAFRLGQQLQALAPVRLFPLVAQETA
ncbi:NAD-binding protein [Thermosynechococcus sp. B0]|uniref:NAD-binding protein n=1 Tax=Thermosynechococcus sp. B0 TaxID=2937284 RepID=UPI0025774ED8|nr:NAD-binding protein [Thermosynechococcus sp. B0]WJI23281.1 NAD-binding protein [Thermosynechococcus sp. B0]